MLRVLPQELCDLVYKELVFSYFLLVQNAEDFTVHYHQKLPCTRKRFYRQFRPLTLEKFPHFFDKAFMGFTFAQGLSAVAYGTLTFRLRHLQDIANFLNHDLLDTDCVPLLHLEHIEVDVSLKRFYQTTSELRDWSSPKFTEPLKRHYNRAIDNLVVLKVIPWKPSGTVLLRVDCQEPASGAKFAEILFPVVYDLKDRGWDVVIQGSYDESRNDPMSTARDFDFTVPRSLWQEKSRINSAFASENVRDATKPGMRN